MGADERLRLERRLTLWAARGGHLAVLQWARANGGDWNGGTCQVAAKGGHHTLLQWAWPDGCPWAWT
jgi:hypothetical protein